MIATPPSPAQIAARLLAVLLVTWAWVLSLWPFAFVTSWEAWRDRLVAAIFWVDLQLLGHLVAAAIIGAAVAIGWPGRVSAVSGWKRGALVLLVVAVLEGLQSALAERHASLADVVAHAGGILLGLSLAAGGAERWRGSRRLGRIAMESVVVACTLATVALAAVEYRLTSFEGWDDKAVLVLGNEATGDRPWHGRLFGAAIYARALEQREVGHLSRDSWRAQDSLAIRMRRRALAIYAPTNAYRLTSHTPLRWLSSGPGDSTLDLFAPADTPLEVTDMAVRFMGQGVVATRSPATLLTDAIRRERAFSVEALVAPTTVAQGGPARIVSLSRSPGKRNFTLAQEGESLSFRLRTPLSGPNGDDRGADAEWPNVFTDTQPRHLMVTCRHGELRLYVDGRPHGRPWRMQAMYRLPGLAASPAATMAVMSALLLLPLGLAGPALWDAARRPRSAVVRWVLAAGVAVVAFHVAAGPTGAWFAVAAVAVGVLLGVQVHPRR